MSKSKPDTNWPSEGLQDVPRCLGCGGNRRKTLYRDLKDETFGSAPGGWILKQCLDCQTAYLDPQPTPAALPIAYQEYYTHGPSAQDRAALDVAAGKRMKLGARNSSRMLINAYRNHRFGSSLPAFGFPAQYLVAAIRPVALYFEANARHLNNFPQRCGRLLDVGCGSGDFLSFAENVGWEAEGFDLDYAAVRQAQSRGLQVRQGSLDLYSTDDQLFHVITVSHVIEHVYDPAKLISDCFRLLRPGGMLWLETPNISSLGHERFGRHWRGLEVPRHLSILSFEALQNMLLQVGFSDIERKNRGLNTVFTYAESELIARGERVRAVNVSPTFAPRYWLDGIRQFLSSHSREFLTITATRPEQSDAI